MSRRSLILASASTVLLAACTTSKPETPADAATKRRSINASADEALARLYKQVEDSRAVVGRARGVLIFPKVVSAGFMVGGSYGEGVLRTGNQPVAYYSTTAVSVGFLAGAESKALFFLFMTDEALKAFRNSSGWTAGADASVSVLRAGASAAIDTQTAKQSVLGYVLTNEGLMANLSIDGTKVQRLDL